MGRLNPSNILQTDAKRSRIKSRVDIDAAKMQEVGRRCWPLLEVEEEVFVEVSAWPTRAVALLAFIELQKGFWESENGDKKKNKRYPTQR